MNKIRVLLINPPLDPPRGIQVTIGSHLGLAYLASFLRQNGHQVVITDCILENLNINKLIELIEKKDVDLIGFSLYQGSIKQFMNIMSVIMTKNITAHITAGGIFPSVKAKELLLSCPRLDSIILGEGEYIINELADALASNSDWTLIEGLAVCSNGNVSINKLRPLICNLDSLPFPATDSIRFIQKRYGSAPASIVSSRGCYGKCTFCHTPTFYRKFPGPIWRSRSPGNVIDEAEALVQEFPIDFIYFYDDTFIGPGKKGRNYAYEVSNEIKSRKLKIKFAILCRANDVEKELFSYLKDVGLVSVFLGIESINQYALDLYEKNINKIDIQSAISVLDELEINYSAGYILFDPYATLDALESSINFWDELESHQYNKTAGFADRLYILKETEIEKKMRSDGLLTSDTLLDGYDCNYRFLYEDVQVVYNAYNEIMTEIIYPLIEKSSVESIVKSIHGYKIDVLKRIIGLFRSGNLNGTSFSGIFTDALNFSKIINKNIFDYYRLMYSK